MSAIRRLEALFPTLKHLIEGITGSTSKLVIALGALLVTIAYVWHDGVWPALLAIWGVALLVFGLVAVGLIRRSRR